MRNKLKWTDRQASVSVEFALISVFFLAPMVGGCADLIEYISAKAQLNTALQSLYYYALTYTPGSTSTLTDPVGTASNPGVITSTNAAAVLALVNSRFHPLTLNSVGVTYDCISNSATTATYSTPISQPAVNGINISGTNNGCASGTTQRTTVTFSVSSNVVFSIPLPLAATNPLTLTETGTVEIY